MKRILLIVAYCASIAPTLAQERNDSVPVGEHTGLSDEEIRELTMPLGLPDEGISLPQTLHSGDIPINPALDPSLPTVQDMHIQLWPKGSRLPRWNTGYMYGYNAQSGSLLYGYTALAGMGVRQRLGSYWSMNAGMELNKYSVYYNTATFSGSLTWQPNPYFSTTVFGNYTRSFMSPVQLGAGFQWGGYVTLQTDTDLPFGIDAGMSSEYNPGSGHWVTPIIRPFVKLGESKLGIDLGPILQNALWKAKGQGHGGGGGPIPKPMNTLPQVAPRR